MHQNPDIMSQTGSSIKFGPIFKVIVALILFGLGYLTSSLLRSGYSNSSLNYFTKPSPSFSPSESNLLFDKQTASIEGKVTAINGDTLTVYDDISSRSAQFVASKDFLVYIPNLKNQGSSASASIKSIILKQEALIELQLFNNRYMVTSITYVPKTAP